VLFVRYNFNYQVKNDEIGRACSMLGGRSIRIGFCLDSQKEIDHKEDLDVGGLIMLKWFLEI
jgi:hypothetical protein